MRKLLFCLRVSGQLWIHEWLTLRHWCLIYELFISLHTPQHKQLYLVICWSYQGCLMLVLLPLITLVLWNLSRIYNQIWIHCTWFILQGSLTLQQPEGFTCTFERIFCWQIWQGVPSAAWEPLVRASSVLTQHGCVLLHRTREGSKAWAWCRAAAAAQAPAHAWGQLQCPGELKAPSVHRLVCRVFPQSLACSWEPFYVGNSLPHYWARALLAFKLWHVYYKWSPV